MTDIPLDRRGAMSVGAVTASAALLAGCGWLNPEKCTIGAPPSKPAAGDGQEIATLADIPVGEAVIPKDDGCNSILVARPTETTAAAFSPVCTHKGVICKADGKRVRCPAHGALFNATSGEVEKGPAKEPLTRLDVEAKDGKVVLR